jgi:hypothetical protein
MRVRGYLAGWLCFAVAIVLDGLDTGEYFKNTGNAHTVKNPRSPLFVVDYTRAFEKAEMAGNGGHFDADHFRQIADGTFATG